MSLPELDMKRKYLALMEADAREEGMVELHARMMSQHNALRLRMLNDPSFHILEFLRDVWVQAARDGILPASPGSNATEVLCDTMLFAVEREQAALPDSAVRRRFMAKGDMQGLTDMLSEGNAAHKIDPFRDGGIDTADIMDPVMFVCECFGFDGMSCMTNDFSRAVLTEDIDIVSEIMGFKMEPRAACIPHIAKKGFVPRSCHTLAVSAGVAQ